MEYPTKDEMAAFVTAVRRAHVQLGAVTPAVLKVLGMLEALAREGGLVVVRNPELEADVADHAVPIDVEVPAAAPPPMPPDPDIPF